MREGRPFVLMAVYLTQHLVAERYLLCQSDDDGNKTVWLSQALLSLISADIPCAEGAYHSKEFLFYGSSGRYQFSMRDVQLRG